MVSKNKIFSKLLSLIQEKNNNWFHSILTSIFCSYGAQKTPLVLDRKNIYLYKYWYLENEVIEFIYRKGLKYQAENFIKYKKLFEKYCPEKIDIHQKLAIKNALLRNIFFIIGGPGTGKTYILTYLILILIKAEKKKINIKLTATTGKAAIKLTQSIYLILKKKLVGKKEKLSFPKTGTTLHQLFNIKKDERPGHDNNQEKYKKIDVLIVDESSMIDLNLMSVIATRIALKTKVIFVGDIHQLPSIEVGSVLQELCDHKPDFEKKKKWKKNIAVLTKKYRFKKNSGINTLIQDIENEKYKNIYKIYKNKFTDIIWREVTNEKTYWQMIKEMQKYYERYRHILNINSTPKQIIQTFNKYRILCAVKDGNFGIKKINKHLDKYFINKQIEESQKPNHYSQKNTWYHGKPILIKKNNISLKIMNGDIGICLLVRKKIKVFFILPDETVGIIDPRALINYETAWSMTIHKSQGSEFSSIKILIPNYSSQIISKELFYTAITRARKKITIYCNIDIIKLIIRNKKKRYSGLYQKLISLKI